jgi:4-diphosphocytidyl-2-C-methyl-D-erythritol kinase
LPAYAKINWSLHVFGRRPDGYHQIETVFQTIGLHDSLTFSLPGDGRITMTCDTAGIPVDDSNLVLRAAKKLRERIGVRVGADIHLEKRIPAPGGLGGGSADAAVTLIGLCRLWQIETEPEILHEIGRELGADVPFFLTGGTALGTGLGDEIIPLEDATATPLLVVTPDLQISTADAYTALRATSLTLEAGESTISVSPETRKLGRFPHQGVRNDFDPVMSQAHPEIARAKALLLENGAQVALLCGSGASVFGTFSDELSRTTAAENLRAGTDWQIFETSTLSRADYAAALGLQ